MSLVSRNGVAKDDRAACEFYTQAVASWAEARPHRWRYVWMLNQRELHGWSYGRIARIVGMDRSHVCRVIKKARRAIAALVNPEVAS